MGFEETLAAFRRGDDAEARRLAQLDLDQAADADGRVAALCMLARLALRAGQLAEVTNLATSAQRVAEEAGERRLLRMPLHLLAVAARMAGRHPEARQLYERSISLNDELGERGMAAAEHRNLAYVEIRSGHLERARELFAESRRRFAGFEHAAMAPYLTFDEATEAALEGDHATATARLHDAERSFEEQGTVPDPDDSFEMAELRSRLGLPGPTSTGRQ